MGFAELEPFGSAVEDMRAGLGPATAINMNRSVKEGEEPPPPVSPFAFFPWHNPKPAEVPQTPDEVAAAIVSTLNAIAKANADGN
jgi:hypothetical protein